MTTGKRIQQARKAAGLSQKQLGEKLGLSASMIGQWENDLRNPKKETLTKIADALDVSVSDICSDELKRIFKMSDESRKLFEETHDTLSQYTLALEQAHAIEVLGGEKIERIVYALDKMNDDGQQEAVKRVEELTEIPRYRAETAPQSPQTPAEGTDTTPPENAPETPPDGE